MTHVRIGLPRLVDSAPVLVALAREALSWPDAAEKVEGEHPAP